MELRALAEQVLFSSTLEEKLRSPNAITDEYPGKPIHLPTMPGRPPRLRFKESSHAGTGFPATRLEQEGERGRLLHFFANHELLATELMALALLRFPEAPAAFRRGVFQTLLDEQEHTRLYLERMRACGIEFGDQPVSGYFWRALARMENPIDYVAGLSLTFEQANLDFAQHFAQAFARVGDIASAHLLERIQRDEIAHVAVGLKWFRRWKNPDESDWAAFCRQLKYPLSPQRAKGFTALNVGARRAAGLDERFIAELSVYSQSKGRTSSVYFFNPFSEGYLAHGPGFTPIKHQAQLAKDLANLPQFLCRQDDIVLVPKRPSVEFLRSLQQSGIILPEFIELGDAPGTALAALSRRRLGGLRPWAWGPDSNALLAPLIPAVTGLPNVTQQGCNESQVELYSKAWSAAFLRTLLAETEPEPWLCPVLEVGTVARTLDEAHSAIAAIRRRGHHRVVIKEALGLAGRNALRLWEPSLLPAQLQWMQTRFARGASLVVEPWLEREFDFSVQFERSPDGLRLRGSTTLLNDRNGQFLGNRAAPNHARHLPSAVARLIGEPADVAVKLRELYERIRKRLETELARREFLGPLGLDAFVYRDELDRCRLKPVVEINPRFTMGRLTLELMRAACPGRQGTFRLINLRKVASAGYPDFSSWARQLQEKLPLCLKGDPVARIHAGAICLNDPAEARACLAVFVVEDPVRTEPSPF